MLFVDSDNAMGSRRGDVDDGFALAAILRSGAAVAGIGSVAGNTTSDEAWRNNRALADLCGFAGPVLRGPAVAPSIVSLRQPVRFIALGPLTNLAEVATRHRGAISEAIVVGGNLSSHGRWPPLWPHEFNLTRDLRALKVVWSTDLPLTVLPLDVARMMRVARTDLDELRGGVGEYLRRNSERWFTRARLLKWSSTIPLFDLPAAIFAIDDEPLNSELTVASLHPNGWIEFAKGSHEVRVIRSFERKALWRRFVGMLNDE